MVNSVKSTKKHTVKKGAAKKASAKRPRSKADLSANERKWGTVTYKQGWTYVPNVLIEHQGELEISPIELNIILVIMKHWWDRDSLPWPSVTKIAEHIGRSRSIVQRHIRELEERGFIKREYRKDKRKEKASLSNEYDIAGLVDAVQKIARKRQNNKS